MKINFNQNRIQALGFLCLHFLLSIPLSLYGADTNHSLSTATQSSATIQSPYEIMQPTQLSTSQPRAFWFPECLKYEVHWGIIDVGYATLCSTEVVKIGDNQIAYHITSEVRSNGFIDAFYKVRDFNEAWLDLSGVYSWGYYKRLREGKFFKDEWVLYQNEEQKFLAQSKNREGQITNHTGAIPGPVLDILSSLYYIRLQAIDIGREYVLDVNTKENWPLVIKALERDNIKTSLGKFDCFVIEPMIRKEGIFIQKGKRLQVWITDDQRKLPVQMKAEIFIGHVSAKLVDIVK